MGSMSASDAAPLPRLGEVFFDVRGSSRSMRLSWYANTGIAVFSIWQGGTCTGTFRLPLDELSRLVESLSRGLADGPVKAMGDPGATGPIALGGQRTRLAIGAGPIEAFTGAMNVLTDEQAAAYGVPRPPQPAAAQNGVGYPAAWPGAANGFAPSGNSNGFAPKANGFVPNGNGNGFAADANGYGQANGYAQDVNGFAPTGATGFGQANGYTQDVNGSGPAAGRKGGWGSGKEGRWLRSDPAVRRWPDGWPPRLPWSVGQRRAVHDRPSARAVRTGRPVRRRAAAVRGRRPAARGRTARRRPL